MKEIYKIQDIQREKGMQEVKRSKVKTTKIYLSIYYHITIG